MLIHQQADTATRRLVMEDRGRPKTAITRHNERPLEKPAGLEPPLRLTARRTGSLEGRGSPIRLWLQRNMSILCGRASIQIQLRVNDALACLNLLSNLDTGSVTP